MTTIQDRWDNDVTLEPGEALLLAQVRELFAKKDDTFRIAFKDAVMEGYCESCGSHYMPCYCMRDD